MRPYLAIIKDSFREALHSYVLWALIAVLSLILLFLLSFSYSEQLVGNLPWEDVSEWRLLLVEMKTQADADGASPGKHVYGMLDAKLRARINKRWEYLNDSGEQPKGDEQPQGEGEEQPNIGIDILKIFSEFHEGLNRLLEDGDIYDRQAWAGVELTDEAKELIAQDSSELSDAHRQRRNRLLLEAAFPAWVRQSRRVEYRPTWMGRPIVRAWLIGAPAATTKEAVVEWYKGYIGWLMNWVVTLTIVFVGIIFTCAMIPRMLEPGAITLLLSKPVRRSYIFIARFFGGCAFMLLSAAYVVTGIFFIAGFHLGIWAPQVFLCIPLFTFVFAVYFAVSAYVGALWRSPLISVFAVIAFYVLCWSIGTYKVWVAEPQFDLRRLTKIVDAGGTTLAMNDSDQIFFWDEETAEWKETFQLPQVFGMGRTKHPLIYDAQRKQLLSTTVSLAAGFYGGGEVLAVGRDQDAWSMKEGVPLPPATIDLLAEPDGALLAVSPLGFYRLEGSTLPPAKNETDTSAQPQNDSDSNGEIDTGASDNAESSETQDVPEVRSESTDLNDETNSPPGSDSTDAPEGKGAPSGGGGQAPIVDSQPIHSGDEPIDGAAGATDTPPRENTDDTAAQPNEPGGLDEVEQSKQGGVFVPAGPDKPFNTTGPMAVAINRERGAIAIYTGGIVAIYECGDDGKYVRREKKELADSEQKAATLAFAGGALLVGRDDGKVIVLDAQSLKQLHEFSPEGEVPPRFIEGAPGGQSFAVLFQNRQLWLYDAEAQKISKADIWSQGDISAVTFDTADSMLVADRVARVRRMKLPSLSVERTLNPVELPGFAEGWRPLGIRVNAVTLYRWVVLPLYTILPRPGELGWTMHYVMTGEKTATFDDAVGPAGIPRSQDISAQRHAQRNPWTPVISCGIFVAVMLALGCWYIERSEF